jgi:hypothetical protein
MIEATHPDDRVIELLALGALEDDAEITEHVSTCDACAAKLAAEARLELALGELHAFRVGHRHIEKPSVVRLHFAPILIVLAAAAMIFFALRSRHASPAPELRADPTAAASAKPGDVEPVIASIRPALRRCLTPTEPYGGALVVLEITIAADGTVSNVEFSTRKNVNDEVADCLVTVVRSARFQATGRTSTVRLPLSVVVTL